MKIAVIGAGSYGTCLAIHLAAQGHEISLWVRSESRCHELSKSRENLFYLPGYRLVDNIQVTSSIQAAVAGVGIVVGVTPSHVLREVFTEVSKHIDDDVILINASKGLEESSHQRIDQIYEELFPEATAHRATYLSGPTFAKEVAAHLPSAIALAGRDTRACEIVQALFSTETFRVYTTEDVVGVLIGGALKNVYAICAGLSDGLGFGHNARAAIITRGLAELSRLGRALGANPMTFMGLSGMGDLVLTCAGDLSRNRRFGLELAKGKSRLDITEEMQMVAEGVKTASAARQMAEDHGVDMPMVGYMYQVLYEGREARAGLTDLIGRQLTRERD